MTGIFYTGAFLTRSSPADYGADFGYVYMTLSEGDSGNQTIVDNTPTTAGTEVIDDSRYSYYMVHLYFSGDSGMRACGVRTDYEYSNFLPAVLKDAAP